MSGSKVIYREGRRIHEEAVQMFTEFTHKIWVFRTFSPVLEQHFQKYMSSADFRGTWAPMALYQLLLKCYSKTLNSSSFFL